MWTKDESIVFILIASMQPFEFTKKIRLRTVYCEVSLGDKELLPQQPWTGEGIEDLLHLPSCCCIRTMREDLRWI